MRGASRWLALMLATCLIRVVSAQEMEYARGVEATDSHMARQQFARAAEAYRTQSPRYAHEFVNRSRAEFLSGNLPYALAACRAGLTQHPGDVDLRRQWAFLTNKAPGTRAPGDFEPLPGFARMPSAGLCALAFAAAWTAAWVCVVPAWTGVNSVWRKRAVLLFAVASLFGGLWSWHALIRHRDQREPLAFVVRDFQVLHQGNSEAYPAPQGLAPLRLGTQLRILVSRGNWLKVGRADGVTGWVPRSAVTTGDS